MPTAVTLTQSASQWRTLGEVAPTTLVAARQTLHHAAQLLALAGASFLAPESDDSHTSMTWMEPLGALGTQSIGAEAPFRFGLRVSDLTLLVIEDSSRAVRAALSLHGETPEQALNWMRDQVSRAGLDGGLLRSRLHFTLAHHVTDAGGAFERPSDGALEELARWYNDAALFLEQCRSAMAGAGPVRCWPHHFDIATLVRLRHAPIQTIGIGLSPGDDSCAEPYYYVGPDHAPLVKPRALTIGAWHTTNWWGAALVASAIVAQRDAKDQAAVVRSFVDDAVQRLLDVNVSGA